MERRPLRRELHGCLRAHRAPRRSEVRLFHLRETASSMIRSDRFDVADCPLENTGETCAVLSTPVSLPVEIVHSICLGTRGSNIF